MKAVFINGSPRPDSASNTYKALMAERDFFKKRAMETSEDFSCEYLKIPSDFSGCIGCNSCSSLSPYCSQQNNQSFLENTIDTIRPATDIILGSPVYLDLPTPQVVAFLTRLNCMAETTDREFFRGKNMWLVSVSFCSGTKTCIHALMGATEMLGFTLPGRGSREYIFKWDDKKLRGGMRRKDQIFLD
ncbi:MAG: NAD(P)H-dependent oxidoreductase [Candidatus Saccharibacteria bacterium]|nr:NAD(P)H-dependent oxidoreductase [Candidatus Saccharibacteria bacterium]